MGRTSRGRETSHEALRVDRGTLSEKTGTGSYGSFPFVPDTGGTMPQHPRNDGAPLLRAVSVRPDLRLRCAGSPRRNEKRRAGPHGGRPSGGPPSGRSSEMCFVTAGRRSGLPMSSFFHCHLALCLKYLDKISSNIYC